MRERKKAASKDQGRNILAFFVFGILNKLPSEIIITAATDILAGSSIATGAATVTKGIANVLCILTIPWFLQKLSFSTKVALIISSYAAGFITITTADSAIVRLSGLCMAEFGRAVLTMTVFSTTAFYSDVSISAVAAGTGVGTVLGSLYYTGKLLDEPSPFGGVSFSLCSLAVFKQFVTVLRKRRNILREHREIVDCQTRARNSRKQFASWERCDGRFLNRLWPKHDFYRVSLSALTRQELSSTRTSIVVISLLKSIINDQISEILSLDFTAINGIVV